MRSIQRSTGAEAMPHLLPHIGTREGAPEQGSIVMLLATDACEQAILHPLWRADPVTGRDGIVAKRWSMSFQTMSLRP